MRNISIFYTHDIQSTILEKNQLFSSATIILKFQLISQ